MTEEEIDALLDQYINRYLRLVGPAGGQARDRALDSVRDYLRGASANDFADGDEFADALFERIKDAYGAVFAGRRAETVVKRTTEQIYRFFRLRDKTAFGGEGSPVKLRFGGPDARAVRFFGQLDNFYFSTFVDNSRAEIKDFLREQYLEKGAALFGRGTKEELDDFRKAAGGKLDKITDFNVETIVQSSVQRVRNYAHVNSLRQARFKLARIRVIEDGRCTTNICPTLDGKTFRVGAAGGAVDRLTQLDPGDYAKELYKSDLGRAFAKDPVGYVADRVGDDGVIDDDLIAEGRGFPPLHPRCRCWVEGVFEK
ncbi:MAG TPA: hypothetical protein VF507_06190 [Pyrinomonadaceae bacterium]|jgi:hypothetical protein